MARCQALNISDEKQCLQDATSSNGLFCVFHARQAQGMYRGYKIRNARLDELNANPPAFLAESKVQLPAQTFKDIEDAATLHELHDYLFRKHSLLERVIRARKIHHSRFYPMQLDYGHKTYLDRLTNDKFNTIRALTRLERRTAEVVYAQQKWYQWVRETQDKEEAERESEKKTVQKEAALYQRHWKELEARLKAARKKENVKMQEDFLEQVYLERMSEDDESTWDPIEDSVEDERAMFLDLIGHLLWIEGLSFGQTEQTEQTEQRTGSPAAGDSPLVPVSSGNENVEDDTVAQSGVKPTKVDGTPLSKNARKKARQSVNKAHKSAASDAEPTVNVNESKESLRERLLKGYTYNYKESLAKYSLSKIRFQMGGTMDNPNQTLGKVVPIPEDEVNQLVDDLAEIRTLLFCRLLLSQASLLDSALRANDVTEFLQDPSVSTMDLRNVCLKLENPDLQAIRDACADYARGDEPDDDDDDDDEEQVLEDDEDATPWAKTITKSAVPKKWRSKNEKAMQDRKDQARRVKGSVSDEEDHTTGLIDFGLDDDSDKLKQKKVKIRICGRTLWNYPSEKAMARGGWLHFSIIAKDSKFSDAVKLCRNWDEFYDLNVLACLRYFPTGVSWLTWQGDRYRQQLLQLGCIPYFWLDRAKEGTIKVRANGPRGHVRNMVEARNFICLEMNRDAATRRFIQYLSMQTHRLVVLARDAKTGRVIVKPPEEQLWMLRKRPDALVPDSDDEDEWEHAKRFDETFFEEMEQYREWSFGFSSYYDIIVWDLEAADDFNDLYGFIRSTLLKALRVREPREIYKPMESIMRTMTRERDTFRLREIKPGENVMSLWDDLYHPDSRMVHGNGPGKDDVTDSAPVPDIYYNEIDETEDGFLFPVDGASLSAAQIGRDMNELSTFERMGPSERMFKRFVNDLDTDEELDSEEEEKWQIQKMQKPRSTRRRRQEEEEDEEEEAEDEADFADDVLTQEMIENVKKKLEEMTSEEKEIDRIMLNFEKGHDFDPNANLYETFMEFNDSERARIFKKAWHQADCEPGAQGKWTQMQRFIKAKAEDIAYDGKTEYLQCLRLMLFMGVHFFEHRRVEKDMCEAYAKMSPFFAPASDAAKEFLELEDMDRDLEDFQPTVDKEKQGGAVEYQKEDVKKPAGVWVQETGLVDNTSRSNDIPDRRRPESNITMPDELWKDWMRIQRKFFKGSAKYPIEYDKTIRPIIAHLFVCGIVQPHYGSNANGQAIAATEHGRKSDLYIDYGLGEQQRPYGPLDGIQDPRPINLLVEGRKFADSLPNGQARFALLRLWSAPHFYPFMLGFDKRYIAAFNDARERCWEWKFMPKDANHTEWSVHENIKARLQRFRSEFGKKVVHKKDSILVMAADEEELQILTTAVTYAVQTKPWRLEIDVWKSFVNVDFDFLEGLDEVWWR